VLSRELSRLSRTDKDWCQLLEVCQVFDTLVADEDQVYDLSTMDDQLVVGIKGTLSVVELKVLQKRLVQGQESKAQRGELFRLLPVGYVLDADGHVANARFHWGRSNLFNLCVVHGSVLWLSLLLSCAPPPDLRAAA
jgi:DNA invertase Pin-like site-specific DNA recombinase